MGTSALTCIEQAKLENLEEVISTGLQSFVEVGNALMQIRDGKLYRLTHGTFEDYCQEKWSIARNYANKLVAAADVVQTLGTVVPKHQLPATESQARPLTRLEPSEQAAAWVEAVKTAPAGKVAAAHVEQVVAKWVKPSAEPIVHETPIAGVIDSLDGLIADGAKFGTIYADPPWQYDNKATRANVEGHYAGTMTLDEIIAMPVSLLAADDAHLHLWTTNSFLPSAFRVMEAWGFDYRSVFVWVKPQMGIGNYWRVSHEFMLLGIRGNAKRFNEHGHKSWLEIERAKHSAKPEAVRGIVERVSPGPFLELFGREQITGWTVFGNQVNAQERFA